MDQDNQETVQPQKKSGLTKTISTVVVLVILAFIIFKINSTKSTPNPTTQTTTTNTTAATSTGKTVQVKLTDAGYNPKSISIHAGDTVTFTNNSQGRMWTASDPHPQHTDYPGFDEKTAGISGATYSFMFTKTGSWGYHNHLNPSQRGTVVVK